MKKIYSIIAAVMVAMSMNAQTNLTSVFDESYEGTLAVTINDQTVSGIPATVNITKHEDTNTVDVVLKNFVLGQGADMIPVGNVNVNGIALAAKNTVVTSIVKTQQDVMLTAGDLEGIPMWFGEILCKEGPIPVTIEGEAGSGYMDIDIDIDLMATMEQMVHVDFTCGTEPEENGVKNITLNTNDNRTFNIAGQQVSSAAKGIIIKNGKKFVK